jgi:adenosylmethionine-8-amino-7-oxononanoate aminotransferase
MVGIELVKDNKTGEEFPNAERIGHRVILEARKRGAILRPLGDVIVLLPPLSINQKQLKELLSVTYESIKTVTS